MLQALHTSQWPRIRLHVPTRPDLRQGLASRLVDASKAAGGHVRRFAIARAAVETCAGAPYHLYYMAASIHHKCASACSLLYIRTYPYMYIYVCNVCVCPCCYTRVSTYA